MHCFGAAARRRQRATTVPAGLEAANPALQTLAVDLEMARGLGRRSDVVHSHTWYANLAGHLAGLLYGMPHVLTAHSLEPMRPWKAEQLGGGYRLSVVGGAHGVPRPRPRSSRCPTSMRADILAAYPFVDPERVHVVRNGIDTMQFRPEPATELVEAYGIDLGRPYVLFVGRITRQKGIAHLLRAAARFEPGVQLVLCASAPDTPEIGAETAGLVRELQDSRGGVVWIQEHASREALLQLLTHALVFLLPVRVRAARHRQPRGDGLRDGGRRVGCRRHPGGRRRRARPGCWCPTTRPSRGPSSSRSPTP